MEIKQLRVFKAVAETNSFAVGAAHFDITEQEISTRIGQLEEEIGLQFFTGGAHRLILTEAGEHLLRRAGKILREHDDALAELAELAGAKHGRLRIGSASAMFATAQLPEILEKLKQKFPNAEIHVSSGTSHKLVERIMRGEINIAFVSLPIENSNIQTDLLFSDEIAAIAYPDHPLAKEKYISAATLAGEQLILGEKGGSTRRLIDDFFAAANVKPNVVMELSRQEAIVKMVENKMGIGIANTESVAAEIRENRLIAWLIEGAEIKRELGLARLRGGYSSQVEKEFVRLCKESFEKRNVNSK